MIFHPPKNTANSQVAIIYPQQSRVHIPYDFSSPYMYIHPLYTLNWSLLSDVVLWLGIFAADFSHLQPARSLAELQHRARAVGSL